MTTAPTPRPTSYRSNSCPICNTTPPGWIDAHRRGEHVWQPPVDRSPTTIGNLDRILTAAAKQLAAALRRIDLPEASVTSERIDNLLDHRLAQMALTR